VADQTPSSLEPVHDPVLVALSDSARGLESDPDAMYSPRFRRRGRAVLLEALEAPPSIGQRLMASRLAGAVLAALLFLVLAMPVLAGPGAVGESVASTVGSLFGFGHEDASPPAQSTAHDATATPTSTPLATATASPAPDEVSTDGPSGHGAEVAAVAHATPLPGQNHGQQVREVARDNHGHAAKPAPTATPTPQSTATPEPTRTAEPTKAPKADHPDNHGAVVSEVAHATPPPGQNHGQQVREVARDNHGHEDDKNDDKKAERAPTATPASPASPEPNKPGQGRGEHRAPDKGKDTGGKGSGGKGNGR
jgi:hypothetical protein